MPKSHFLTQLHRVVRLAKAPRMLYREARWLISDARFSSAGLYCATIHSVDNGLFAQLSGLMYLLVYCQRHSLTPHIVLSCPLYSDSITSRNILDTYFTCPTYTPAQLSLINTLPIRRVDKFSELREWSRELLPEIESATKLFRQFYRVRVEIESEVDAFTKAHLPAGRTLGVHYRGTDKSKEATSLTFEQVSQHISQHMQRFPHITTVYLATDTAQLVTYVRKTLRSINVVTREETRSHDGNPLHLSGFVDPYILGKDALVNCLILARCSALLKTMSNLSAWAKVFNPDIPVYLMNRPAGQGITWLGFPEQEMVSNRWFAPMPN